MELKELQKLIQLCRKSGVTSIKIEGVELTLSEEAPAPAKPRGKSAAKASASEKLTQEDRQALEGQLSPEELMFWSTNYVPEETQEGAVE